MGEPERLRAPVSVRFWVPYDTSGNRATGGDGTYWDLSQGQQVRLHARHNVTGARQPSYMHITTKTIGTVGRRDEVSSGFYIEFGGSCLLLGFWWLAAAQR